MSTSPLITEKRLKKAVNAWETLAPTKTFGGFTLTQFKEKAEPSFTLREEIIELELQRGAKINDRDDIDLVSMEALLLVVNGVKGDPTEGEDSDLYEAMGYIRKSERRSGLHRTATDPTDPTPPPA